MKEIIRKWGMRLGFLCLLVLQGSLVYVFTHLKAPSPPKQQADQFKEAPPGTTIDVEGLPSLGSSNAKVVLIEFSDYECPFCARHAVRVGKKLEEKFSDAFTAAR